MNASSGLADPNTQTPRALSLRHRFTGMATQPSSLALIDQAIVSGTNFLTTVFIGRICSQSELGLYSLGFTWIVLLASLQEASILVPYTVFGNRLEPDERTKLAGTCLLHHGVLAVLAMLVLAGCGIVSGILADASETTSLLWVVAGIVPFCLMREFHRRIAFAHLQMGRAVVLDGIMAGLQLGLLLVLAWQGSLSALTAQGAVGVACAISVGLIFYWTRRNFDVRYGEVGEVWKRHWKFSKWLVAGQFTGVAHGFVLYWLLALFLGSKETGIFAACMTIVMLTNPLFLGIGNATGPKAAQAAPDGPHAIWNATRSTMFLLVGVMGLFAVGMLFFGGFFLNLLYGPDYVPYAEIVAVLAFGVLAGAVGLVPDHILRALERSDITFRASVIGFLVTVGSSIALIQFWGTLGGAWGYLLGSWTSSGIRLWYLRRTLRECS